MRDFGKLKVDLIGKMLEPTMVYYENQSCIRLFEKLCASFFTKDKRYLF